MAVQLQALELAHMWQIGHLVEAGCCGDISKNVARLGLPVLAFFGREGSPTKIDYKKKGTLILNFLLEDLVG